MGAETAISPAAHDLLSSRLYCRPRNFTESCLAARGLYHRWGISPRPEDPDSIFLHYNLIRPTCQVPHAPSPLDLMVLLPTAPAFFLFLRKIFVTFRSLPVILHRNPSILFFSGFPPFNCIIVYILFPPLLFPFSQKVRFFSLFSYFRTCFSNFNLFLSFLVTFSSFCSGVGLCIFTIDICLFPPYNGHQP